MAQKQFEIEWDGDGRKATSPPDPRYPDGIHIDGAKGATRSCLIRLPYPAAGCGRHMVRCKTCGLTVAVTAAGRPDDPRSVRIPCKPRLH